MTTFQIVMSIIAAAFVSALAFYFSALASYCGHDDGKRG